MRQEEIVNEIRKKCGHMEMLPQVGWHFIYNDRHFFGTSEGMIRFCVPHLVKANEYNAEKLISFIKQAQSYQRDAEYYTKQALGYEREVDY